MQIHDNSLEFPRIRLNFREFRYGTIQFDKSEKLHVYCIALYNMDAAFCQDEIHGEDAPMDVENQKAFTGGTRNDPVKVSIVDYNYTPFQMLPAVNALLAGFAYSILMGGDNTVLGYFIASSAFMTVILGVWAMINSFMIIGRIARELNRDIAPSKATFRTGLKYTPPIAIVISVFQILFFLTTTILFIWQKYFWLGPAATAVGVAGTLALAYPAWIHWRYKFPV